MLKQQEDCFGIFSEPFSQICGLLCLHPCNWIPSALQQGALFNCRYRSYSPQSALGAVELSNRILKSNLISSLFASCLKELIGCTTSSDNFCNLPFSIHIAFNFAQTIFQVTENKFRPPGIASIAKVDFHIIGVIWGFDEFPSNLSIVPSI